MSVDAEIDWAKACGEDSEAYGKLIRSLTNRSVLRNAVAIARREKTDQTEFLRHILDQAARQFPSTGFPLLHTSNRDDETFANEMVAVAADIAVLDLSEKQAWRSWFLENDARVPGDDAKVEQLALKVLDAEACVAVLRDKDLSELGEMAVHATGVLRAIAVLAREDVVKAIRAGVRNEEPIGDTIGQLTWTLRNTVDLIAADVVAEAGVVLGSDRVELREVLTKRVSSDLLKRMDGIAEAHRALARVRGDVDRIGVQGASELVHSIATTQPEDWSEYLRIALWRKADDAALVQPTLEAAQKTTRTTAVLKELVELDSDDRLRDRARALLSLIEGTGDRPSRAALARLVELVDGPGVFPHPLALSSSTWMGSLDLEAVLRRRIEIASRQIANELPGQLGRNEEKLTTRVLTILQGALSDAKMIGDETAETSRRVEISCEYRELSKSEEAVEGADVAWMLDVDISNRLRFTQVEFVQAKKALHEERVYYSKWSVDTEQLKTLLGRSQTAVYWLYGPDGTIHVVPARLIYAILVGERRASVEHAVIDIAHVRSMSIPLAQFLVDLFVGTWIGSGTEAALDIAHGRNIADKPDILFTVSVRAKRG